MPDHPPSEEFIVSRMLDTMAEISRLRQRIAEGDRELHRLREFIGRHEAAPARTISSGTRPRPQG